ncbi:potassium channel protein [Waterburya agarophytonicola K14]|uniref:Potassium channel protein n=1 Tax=Waterburya agarophytonicola KI4 TaxID=2874699 RepID=A0A964BPE0_9CYAN|nr:potassium channel protein [Waterburya agarophytonicola]MCC0175475.1 potassium channel protein [Waterburya agarophytonicola KI4]
MYSYTFEEKYGRLRKELVRGGVALASIVLIGTLWYWLVEKWSFSESAYMTVITLSTVGFSEVRPLGERGRLFTVALILMGLLTIGYIVNRFTEALIQGYFQEGIKLRQEKNLIESLDQHYIVCGFGRTGRHVAREFFAEGIPFIIIDDNIEEVEEIKQLGYTVILGDATLDESLVRAKIDRAICLVTALPSDAENLYTVLSAKTLNPRIRAIARASNEEAVQKLQRAGADAVVSPYITGGKRLAAAALRPQVMDFVDGIIAGSNRSYYLEEFLIDPEACPYVGKSLREAKLRSQSGALVLAIRRIDGNLIAGPTGETRILEQDALICMGTAEQLRNLNQILGPINSGKSLRLPKKK